MITYLWAPLFLKCTASSMKEPYFTPYQYLLYHVFQGHFQMHGKLAWVMQLSDITVGFLCYRPTKTMIVLFEETYQMPLATKPPGGWLAKAYHIIIESIPKWLCLREKRSATQTEVKTTFILKCKSEVDEWVVLDARVCLCEHLVGGP